MIALSAMLSQAEWLVGYTLLSVGLQLAQLYKLRRIARDLQRLKSAQVVMCPARAIAAACADRLDA